MDMSHMSSTMTMAMSTTGTAAAAAATSTQMSMGGMSMGGTCKISMLWNWYTIDACFLARSWRIRSTGAFAGSCIGVVLLVVILEGLRRLSREYDMYIVRSAAASRAAIAQSALASAGVARSNGSSSSDDGKTAASANVNGVDGCAPASLPSGGYRPTVLQQAVRALLHMLQFALAYIIMLLAMYYNGYIIICIFIGAYVGAFIFSWHPIGGAGQGSEGIREITYCCG